MVKDDISRVVQKLREYKKSYETTKNKIEKEKLKIDKEIKEAKSEEKKKEWVMKSEELKTIWPMKIEESKKKSEMPWLIINDAFRVGVYVESPKDAYDLAELLVKILLHSG